MTTTKNRFCVDCQKPTSGVRCGPHATAFRIGKPRGVAKPGPRVRPRERSARDLYPLPIPSDDVGPLTIAEQGKARCTKVLIETGADVCFPSKGVSGLPGKVLCHECPIQARCLAIAIANDEPVGIWGGATPGERDKIRRKNPERWGGKAVRTHCKNGHEYTEDSAYRIGGEQRCRRCQADANARYKAAKAERGVA